MIQSVLLDRVSKSGRYGDLLDVLEHLADECGSATNAAAVCIRESARFQRAFNQVRKSDGNGKGQSETPPE